MFRGPFMAPGSYVSRPIYGARLLGSRPFMAPDSYVSRPLYGARLLSFAAHLWQQAGYWGLVGPIVPRGYGVLYSWPRMASASYGPMAQSMAPASPWAHGPVNGPQPPGAHVSQWLCSFDRRPMARRSSTSVPLQNSSRFSCVQPTTNTSSCSSTSTTLTPPGPLSPQPCCCRHTSSSSLLWLG